MASGDQASPEPRQEDIVLDQNPAPAGSVLAATFPIVASRDYSLTDLQKRDVHIDVAAGRELVRRQTGGNNAVQLQDGGARLNVAAGSLPIDTDLEMHADATLSTFLPTTANATPLAEAVVDFSNQVLTTAAQLSVVAASAASPTDAYVVAHAAIHRASKGAGLVRKASCHLLRHSSATHLLRYVADIRSVQLLLGHARLESTRVYADVEVGDLKRMIARSHPRQKSGA